LIGAHKIVSISAAGTQDGIEIGEDAKCLFLALWELRVRRGLGQYIRRYTVGEILRHEARREHPPAGFHSLRELYPASAEFDWETRFGAAVSWAGHRVSRVVQ
jgi:hypothetical protein